MDEYKKEDLIKIFSTKKNDFYILKKDSEIENKRQIKDILNNFFDEIVNSYSNLYKDIKIKYNLKTKRYLIYKQNNLNNNHQEKNSKKEFTKKELVNKILKQTYKNLEDILNIE